MTPRKTSGDPPNGAPCITPAQSAHASADAPAPPSSYREAGDSSVQSVSAGRHLSDRYTRYVRQSREDFCSCPPGDTDTREFCCENAFLSRDESCGRPRHRCSAPASDRDSCAECNWHTHISCTPHFGKSRSVHPHPQTTHHRLCKETTRLLPAQALCFWPWRNPDTSQTLPPALCKITASHALPHPCWYPQGSARREAHP